MMRACLVHNGASSSGWVGEGQSLSRSVHQTQLCSVQCTLSFAPRGVCSAPSWAVCCASWTVCNTVCRAEVCKPDPAPSQGCIVLLHPHSTASVLHVWQSCNLATVQCTMVAHRSPSVEIIFKLESSSLLCEPLALYAENIIP